MSAVATAIVGGAIVGGLATGYAANQAADAQGDAAAAANATQLQMYNTTRGDLQPYNLAGQGALNQLMLLSGGQPTLAPNLAGRTYLTPEQMTQIDQARASMPQGGDGGWGGMVQKVVGGIAQQRISDQFGSEGMAYFENPNQYRTDMQAFQDYQQNAGQGGGGNQIQLALENLPGYQFALQQGLKAVQNSASARGLGVSGAAMKGAASYATGLADQTFGAQWDRLMGMATLGENAATQSGAFGTQTGANIGNNLIGAGNAQAAASIAQGQAIAGVANTAGNMFMTNSLLKQQGYTGFFGE